MKTEIRKLHLKSLKETEGNPQKMDDKTFSGLVASIRKKGWYFALPDVWEYELGQYKIISGHHRIRAAMQAGILEHDCNVIVDKDYNEEQAKKDLLESNERHGQPDELLLTDFVENLIDDYDIDLDSLIDDIGIDDSVLIKDNEKEINEKEIDENNINVDYECPKCGYKWS